jgi:hypothetical protein
VRSAAQRVSASASGVMDTQATQGAGPHPPYGRVMISSLCPFGSYQ